MVASSRCGFLCSLLVMFAISLVVILPCGVMGDGGELSSSSSTNDSSSSTTPLGQATGGQVQHKNNQNDNGKTGATNTGDENVVNENDDDDDDVIGALQDSFGGDSKSLLFWALEASSPEALKEMRQNQENQKSDDASFTTAQQEQEARNRRAAEVRAFAKTVLKEQKTETDILREAVQALRNDTSDDDEKLVALGNIADLVRSYDHATDFIGATIAGVPDVVRATKCTNDDVSSAAVAAIAAGSGNQAEFVKAVLTADADFASHLVSLMEQPPASRQRRAVIALGHLVRTQAIGEVAVFAAHDGGDVARRAADALRSMVRQTSRDPRLAASALALCVDIVRLAGTQGKWAEALDASIQGAVDVGNGDVVEKALACVVATAPRRLDDSIMAWHNLGETIARTRDAILEMDDDDGTLAKLVDDAVHQARAVSRRDSTEL